MTVWHLMPADVHVVLQATTDHPGIVQVNAVFRPGMASAELERAGRWARKFADGYRAGMTGDQASDGRIWRWHGGQAMHVLIGHRDEINLYGW